MTRIFLLAPFTAEETKGQGGWVTHYRSHSQQIQDPSNRNFWFHISWCFLPTILIKGRIKFFLWKYNNVRKETVWYSSLYIQSIPFVCENVVMQRGVRDSASFYTLPRWTGDCTVVTVKTTMMLLVPIWNGISWPSFQSWVGVG